MADLELRVLRMLVALADHGTAAAAAKALHLSQPALSKQIALAERVTGLQLFERHPRGMRLTAAGEVVVERARAVLSQAQALTAETDRLRRTVAGTLRLGFVAQAANEYTPDLLRAFADRYPGVTVELRQFDMRDLSAGLATAESDLALVRQPVDVEHLAGLELLLEPRVAVLPAAHPLAARAQVSLAELFPDPWVVSASTFPAWQQYALATDQRAEEPVLGPTVHTVDEFLEVVAGGLGIGLAPQSAVRFYRRPGIAFVAVPDAEPSMCTLSWRADLPQSAPARAFVDTVRDRLSAATG